MEHLIDKSALVAELEKRKKFTQALANSKINSHLKQFYAGRNEGSSKFLISSTLLK